MITARKFIILVLHVDDILLANNDIGTLHETKDVFSKTFEMKDLVWVIFYTSYRNSQRQGLLFIGIISEGYINVY